MLGSLQTYSMRAKGQVSQKRVDNLINQTTNGSKSNFPGIIIEVALVVDEPLIS